MTLLQYELEYLMQIERLAESQQKEAAQFVTQAFIEDENRPDGLEKPGALLLGILNGSILKAPPAHLSWLLSTLERKPPRKEKISAERVKLHERLHDAGPTRFEWLQEHKLQKAFSIRKLFKTISNPPSGLNAALIQSWLVNNKTARWEHWIAVKQAIKAYPGIAEANANDKKDLQIADHSVGLVPHMSDGVQILSTEIS